LSDPELSLDDGEPSSSSTTWSEPNLISGVGIGGVIVTLQPYDEVA